MPKVYHIEARVHGDGFKVGAPDGMTPEQIREIAAGYYGLANDLKIEWVVLDITGHVDILDHREVRYLVSDGGEAFVKDEAVDWLEGSDT